MAAAGKSKQEVASQYAHLSVSPPLSLEAKETVWTPDPSKLLLQGETLDMTIAQSLTGMPQSWTLVPS